MHTERSVGRPVDMPDGRRRPVVLARLSAGLSTVNLSVTHVCIPILTIHLSLSSCGRVARGSPLRGSGFATTTTQ